jgi:hypothetical protein
MNKTRITVLQPEYSGENDIKEASNEKRTKSDVH